MQMPSEMFVFFDDKSVSGPKVRKELVTILPCANASGELALKMVVVGKSNPYINNDLPLHH